METTMTFDIETRWPELFTGLTPAQHDAVVETLANAWHEGFEPERDHVELLAAYVRGDIDRGQYDQQTAALRAASKRAS